MQCGKCKAKVSQEMKFALMKNICPFCGARLFSDKEMNDISMLKNRLASQSFAATFTEELAFDLALFILDEIKNGLGQKYMQSMVAKSGPPISSDDNETVETSEEDYKRRLREEIEQEFPELQDMLDEATITTRTRAESADEKAKRLRDIARKSGMGNKQGAMIRRVGG